MPKGLVKELPQIRYDRRLWFVDEKAKEIRRVDNPHEFLDFKQVDEDKIGRRDEDEV